MQGFDVTRFRLEAFFRQHDPSRLPEIDALLAANASDEPTLFKRLHSQYDGAAAAAAAAPSSSGDSLGSSCSASPRNATGGGPSSASPPVHDDVDGHFVASLRRLSARPTQHALHGGGRYHAELAGLMQQRRAAVDDGRRAEIALAETELLLRASAARRRLSAAAKDISTAAGDAVALHAGGGGAAMSRDDLEAARRRRDAAACEAEREAEAHASRVFEETLRHFYGTHNRAKLKEVPALLEKYKGREEELFRALAEKYLDLPPEGAAVRAGDGGGSGSGSSASAESGSSGGGGWGLSSSLGRLGDRLLQIKQMPARMADERKEKRRLTRHQSVSSLVATTEELAAKRQEFVVSNSPRLGGGQGASGRKGFARTAGVVGMAAAAAAAKESREGGRGSGGTGDNGGGGAGAGGGEEVGVGADANATRGARSSPSPFPPSQPVAVGAAGAGAGAGAGLQQMRNEADDDSGRFFAGQFDGRGRTISSVTDQFLMDEVDALLQASTIMLSP